MSLSSVLSAQTGSSGSATLTHRLMLAGTSQPRLFGEFLDLVLRLGESEGRSDGDEQVDFDFRTFLRSSHSA